VSTSSEVPNEKPTGGVVELKVKNFEVFEHQLIELFLQLTVQQKAEVLLNAFLLNPKLGG
jgi:hypothetical protein